MTFCRSLLAATVRERTLTQVRFCGWHLCLLAAILDFHSTPVGLDIATSFCVPENMSGMQGLIESMALDIKQLKAEQEKTQKEVDCLRAEARKESISFGGHTFYSKECFVSFVREHVKSGYYGFCFDFVSLLECFPDWNRSTDAGLAIRAMILGAGYSDTYQARIDTSFHCIIPKVFGGKVDVFSPETNLANMKSMDDWYTLQCNVKDFITRAKLTVIKQIKNAFGVHSPAGLLFLSLINHTVKFWEKYSAWVFQFEKMLCFNSCGEEHHAQKASVWKLISCLTRAMFLEMSVRRAPGTVVLVAGTSNDADSDGIVKCAAILHGTLGAHKFMEELIEANFSEHPVFAVKIVDHLLLSSASHGSVTGLQAEVKSLKGVVQGIQSKADKAFLATKK